MERETDTYYVVPIILGVLANLNVIDWALTDYAISHRLAEELNPVNVWLMDHGLFNIFKLAGSVFPIIACGYVGSQESKGLFKEIPYGSLLYVALASGVIFIIVVYLLIIWNNAMGIRSALR